ncbi:MAG: hypothetical protein JWP51_1552 [Bradyrhizobium sp.]|nr:hypothetical protein [Bradyrhizobium sp.]
MANDYNNLPTGMKVLKFIVGLCPALVTWKMTGNIWSAAAVFLIGLVAGMAVSSWYIGYLSRNAHRDASGELSGAEVQRVLRQSLPVFLWAPAVCGIVAATSFIWLSISN